MQYNPDIFTVDSTARRVVDEAFEQGRLLFPTHESVSAHSALSWGDYPLNWILVVVGVVACLIFVGRLVELLPDLLGSLARWKVIVNLEDSVPRSRDRNRVFMVSIIPLCLLVSKYGIYSPAFMDMILPEWHSLVVIGAAVGYFLVRFLLHGVVSAFDPTLRSEKERVGQRSLYNFWILATATTLLVSLVLLICGVNSLVIKTINIYILAFFTLVFLLRRTQILTNYCNQFQAILYLCALEILPLALLVLSAVFF